MKERNLLKTLKIGGGLLTNVKHYLSLLFILTAVAACSNDDPVSDNLSTPAGGTRAAADSTQSAPSSDGGFTLRADTAWRDTIRSSFDSTAVSINSPHSDTATFSSQDILPQGDASEAASRINY